MALRPSSAQQEELRLQRVNTRAYINSDPTEVLLHYRSETPNGAGGTRFGPQQARQPQVMRLIEEVGGGERTTYTVDGKAVQANFLLLGEHDATVEVGDRFLSADGREMQVVFIRPDQRYQTTAEVVHRGR